MNRTITLIIFFFFYTNANAIKVKAGKVIHEDFYDEYSFVGECRKSISQDFYATNSGKITEISALEGENIKAGSIILKIDGPLYEAKYNASKHSFERNKSLFDKSMISSQLFERSKADFAAVNKDYENMIIKAPFDGKLGAIKYSIGEVVAAGDYLVSIIRDDSNAEILVYLPEKLMPLVTKESKVELLHNNTYVDKTTIKSISSYLDKDLGGFLVKIYADGKYRFTHGSYTRVKFLLNMHNGLSIPEKSVMQDNDGSFVFLVIDGTTHKKYITLGSRIKNNIEVKEGLKEKDTIVTEGLTNISDRSKIEVIE